MTRRTVGAARVPAAGELAAAFRVLDLALRWMRTPPATP
jgi:hypothetical protein